MNSRMSWKASGKTFRKSGVSLPCFGVNCFIAIALIAPADFAFGIPDCSSVNQWPTRSALVALKNAGLIEGAVDSQQTKVERLASEPLGDGTYRQVYYIKIVERSGRSIEIIVNNLASDEECSLSDVDVFVVSARLPKGEGGRK